MDLIHNLMSAKKSDSSAGRPVTITPVAERAGTDRSPGTLSVATTQSMVRLNKQCVCHVGEDGAMRPCNIPTLYSDDQKRVVSLNFAIDEKIDFNDYNVNERDKNTNIF